MSLTNTLAAVSLVPALLASALCANGARADAAHPPIIAWCAPDPAPCISISEAPVAPANTVLVTGYVQGPAAQMVQVVVTDPRFGVALFTTVNRPTPLVGDYAGYSQFRFTVSAQPGGGRTIYGRNEYLQVQVNALTSVKGGGYKLISASAEDQVWSPGYGL